MATLHFSSIEKKTNLFLLIALLLTISCLTSLCKPNSTANNEGLITRNDSLRQEKTGEKDPAPTANEESESSNKAEIDEAPEDLDIELDSSMKAPLGALVIISGDMSVGSGFLAEIKGRYFIVTNIHVLAANKAVEYTTASGKTLTPNAAIFVAQDEDIAIIPIDQPTDYLTAAEDINELTNIGDKVLVFGNSQGAEVVTRLAGKIKGIGPNRFEVTAGFVPGNSGSPIIHAESGTVIGVASYLVDYSNDKNKWLSGSEFTTIRRFGYRIDSVKQWQRATLQSLHKDHQILTEYESIVEGVFVLAQTLNNANRYIRESEAHPSLKPYIRDFFNVYDGRHHHASDGNKRARSRLRKDVEAVLGNGLSSTENKLKYSFFKTKIKDSIYRGESINQWLKERLGQ